MRASDGNGSAGGGGREPRVPKGPRRVSGPSRTPRALLGALAGLALCLLAACAADGPAPPPDPALALYDPNGAVRMRAVHAAVARGDPAFVPRLVDLLDDPDGGVRLAAGRALRELTGHDTGYRADLPDAQRREHIARWRAWYSSSRAGGSAGTAAPPEGRAP